MKNHFYGLLAVMMTASAVPSVAVVVPNGTVTAAGLFNPTVTLSSDPATYSAMNGGTFETAGTGGFTAVSGLTGFMNGTLLFSNIVGTTLSQSSADFFVFNDGRGGTYNYSVTSVTTNAFVDQGTVAQSGTLFLLGSIANANLGFTPTASSLTVQFNSTGSSPFATSASLAVPPTGVVPEPATWVMFIGGVGLVGGVLRRRRTKVRTTVNFA